MSSRTKLFKPMVHMVVGGVTVPVCELPSAKSYLLTVAGN